VFVSQNQRIATASPWMLEFKLPTQILSSLILAVADAAKTVGSSVTGLMTANFAVNLVMSTSL